MLLQAPAGSGKTTVLVQRFLRLLAVVDEPEQVLAITFTRKAAAEMRDRVLRAIEGRLPDGHAEPERWRSLRDRVLAHARERDWDVLELPTRLRIQTIDSLNHELARAMPLLGRLQSSLDVVDDARELYLQAARNTLRGADADPRQLADIDELLQRLDNDWDRAEQLLAGLLASRGRWLPVLLRSGAAGTGRSHRGQPGAHHHRDPAARRGHAGHGPARGSRNTCPCQCAQSSRRR